MKNSFNVEILKTNKTLTTEEQNTFRLIFQPLLKLEGIISLCLEEEELFVEFDPTLIKLDSFKFMLIEAEFPLESETLMAS
jgi:hypothetical protein